MKHLKPFLQNTGQIVRFYEVFIPKSGKKIETRYHEMIVLLTHKNNSVILHKEYNKLYTINIKKDRRSDDEAIGHVKSYVRNWGSGLLDYNGLVGVCYSYQSEKIVKRRVHNSLKKLILKEYGAYGIMIDRLEALITEMS